MKAVPFLVVYSTVFTVLAGVVLGGPWTWATPILVFALVPVVDQLAGLDTDPTADGGATWPFDAVLRMWLPVQIGLLLLALHHIATASPTPWEWAGLVVSLGLVSGGGGINVAHELMHRPDARDRGLSELLMTLVSYPHFCIEHVHGHHRHVGTPRDPATARLGESVYAFLPRVVLGTVRSAVALERARNQRRGVVWFSPRNRLLRCVVGVAGVYAAVGAVFGAAGVGFFALQSAVAILLLEVINYVEHYGLARAEVSPGRFERVQPRHSWNANHRITNWWLFNLQRHADHHANARRPYYDLRALDDGPQLPLGYPTMLLLALVPPVWRAVMDPRVQAPQVEAAA